MNTFTINNKEYTHKELNLIYSFFTKDQWNTIITTLDNEIVEINNCGDDEVYTYEEIITTIQQLWRSAY